ncbi:MAG: hypothetical protein KVP17_004878 [Porospora cf. gigantea B]|nr:MAG: hypothetical protein KVP17_004878 [Porospora cf. gigantea B]
MHYDPTTLARDQPHEVPLKRDTTHVTTKVSFRNPKAAEVIRELLKRRIEAGSVGKVRTVRWMHPILIVAKVPNAKTPDHYRLVHALQRVNANCELITTVYCQGSTITADLHGMNIFTKIDLSNYFDQLPLHEDSWDLFGFAGPDSDLYVMKSVPQGYCNATAVGQAFLRKVLDEANLSRFGSVGKNSVDDVLLAAKSTEELMLATKELLKLLIDKYNLAVNFAKSQFFVTECFHHGMILGREGYRMPADKAAILDELRLPESVEEVRSFLAWTEQWTEYCPRIQEYMASISDLLKKATPFAMTTERTADFWKIVAAVKSGEVLKYPNFDEPFEIFLDFSSKAFHYFLKQSHGAIRFDGRKTHAGESSWSSTRGEAKALELALDKYEPFIFGVPTTVFTDARNLLSLQGARLALDHHLERLRQKVARFPLLKIVHLPGKCNPADFPSRCIEANTRGEVNACKRIIYDSDDEGVTTEDDIYVDIEEVISPPDIEEEISPPDIEEEIPPTEETVYLERQGKHSAAVDPWITQLEDWIPESGGLNMLKDGKRCPKPEDRIALTIRYHYLSHAGTEAVLAGLRLRYWWPLMRADVSKVVKCCDVCRMSKARKLTTGVQPWADPKDKLERVHADHFQLRQEKFLLVIDALTLFIWVRKVSQLDTRTTYKQLRRIFLEYGWPRLLAADNGPGFTAELDARLKSRGTERVCTIPHKPQSNGLAERGVGIIKLTSKKLMACFPDMTLDSCVEKAVESTNQTPSVDYHFSPFALMFGKNPHTLLNLTETWLEKYQEIRKAVRDRRAKKISEQEKPSVGAEVLVVPLNGKIQIEHYPLVFTVLKADRHTCLVTNGDMEIQVPYDRLRLLPRLPSTAKEKG